MKCGWRWFGEGDPISLREIRQAGVTDVVTSLYTQPVGAVWPLGAIRAVARAVRRLPYSRHEWMVAVNGRFISKTLKRAWGKRRIGLGLAVNLAWRSGFYRAMRRIVNDNFGIISEK